jgi:hypothetical protein
MSVIAINVNYAPDLSTMRKLWLERAVSARKKDEQGGGTCQMKHDVRSVRDKSITSW